MIVLEQKIDQHWWLKPQPAWLIIVLATLFMFIVLGIWNLTQVVFASSNAEEGAMVAITTTQASNLLPYQGFLTRTSGQPLNSTNNFVFRLYHTSSGGSVLWSEIHTSLPVQDGLFNVLLGSQTSGGIPADLWQSPLYLEIVLNGETLAPRELVKLGTAHTALSVPDGSITNRQLTLTHYTVPMTVSDHFRLTSVEQLMGEATITVDYDSTYLTFLTYGANGHSGRSILYLRDVGGNNLCAIDHTSDNVLHTSKTCIFDLPAGTHTLKLFARTASAVVGQEVRNGTHANLVPLFQAP